MLVIDIAFPAVEDICRGEGYPSILEDDVRPMFEQNVLDFCGPVLFETGFLDHFRRDSESLRFLDATTLFIGDDDSRPYIAELSALHALRDFVHRGSATGDQVSDMEGGGHRRFFLRCFEDMLHYAAIVSSLINTPPEVRLYFGFTPNASAAPSKTQRCLLPGTFLKTPSPDRSGCGMSPSMRPSGEQMPATPWADPL